MRSYVIKGGLEGRERLRLLGRVMAPATNALFDRLDLPAGLRCLDAGCGGGNVTLELARRVGQAGHVTGIDADATVIDIARNEAAASGAGNADFRVADVNEPFGERQFDLVYARFLLTHLPDPHRVLENMLAALQCYAEDPTTIMSIPRIVQSWGTLES